MKKNNKIRRVVYSPVVADLFHYGHLQSLKFANSKGDYHICGVLTDKAASFYKKNLISKFEERKEIISNLTFIDRVITQKNKDPTANLKKIHEEFKNAEIVLVHGDDWRTITGEKFIKQINGNVVTHPYYTGLSDINIIKKFLEKYQGKFKTLEEFTSYFDLKNFTYYNPRRINETMFSSKADTLNYLRKNITRSKIEETFVFTVLDWEEEREEILSQIQKLFSPKKIVVRSSTVDEDASDSSMAGCFHSELDVGSNKKKEVKQSIEKVIKSYNEKKSDFMINQILVQPHSKNVVFSGVVFTKDPDTGADYYIINYDDSTGLTDTVTKGIENKTIRIFKNSSKEKYSEKIRILIKSIEEICFKTSNENLDIEFGINSEGKVIIFQVRPLILNRKISSKMKQQLSLKLSNLEKKVDKLSSRKINLAGNRTLFCDMTDWNPAEIIGDNPHFLDFCLYDYIITDSIWHKARTSQGYFDVKKAPLVVLFGNKPYVDVRNSFNSFIPENISKKIREKLVNFYLEKLKKNPELQDKVEFKILLTCYDLNFQEKSKELLKNGFSKNEITILKNSLLDLTNKLIIDSKKSIPSDLNSVMTMSSSRKNKYDTRAVKKLSPQEIILKAKKLLDDCKQYGTLQFSRLARLAFVGNTVLRSLLEQKAITKEYYENFLNSIHTVAKKMTEDFDSFSNSKMSKLKFFNLYGHLRPGTYDVTSKRYDENQSIFQNKTKIKDAKKRKEKKSYKINHNKITKIIGKNGLQLTSEDLFSFIKKSIEARELSKFEFTKNLSAAIELIAIAGEKLGFSRKEIANLDLKKVFENINKKEKNMRDMWKKIIDAKMKERKLNDLLHLPSTILSKSDLRIVQDYSPKPNFITQKRVTSKIIDLLNQDTKEISGKIVRIENGDPGYDWIFTKNPAGLITKYGGVASHMAIRCGEFGLPAAIGCGNIFENMKEDMEIVLDCNLKKIELIK